VPGKGARFGITMPNGASRIVTRQE
jgi:hypothetical protein